MQIAYRNRRKFGALSPNLRIQAALLISWVYTLLRYSLHTSSREKQIAYHYLRVFDRRVMTLDKFSRKDSLTFIDSLEMAI